MRRSQEANGQHKSPRLIREDEERENVIQRKDADRETEDERERRREKEEETQRTEMVDAPAISPDVSNPL